MRATFTKLVYILPILLAFISMDLMGQTQAQLDEIKSYERKIEMNKDNPHFDVETAKAQLKALKQQYGVTSEKSAEKSNTNDASPFSSAVSKDKAVAGNNENSNSATVQTRSAGSLKMFAIHRDTYNSLPAEGKNLIADHADNIIIIEQGASIDKNVKLITQQEVNKFLSLPVEKRNYYLNKLEQQ